MAWSETLGQVMQTRPILGYGAAYVGGVVATRASWSPPLRDQILEMRVLLPTGDVVHFGAKTMKNVAGTPRRRRMPRTASVVARCGPSSKVRAA